MWKAAAAPGSAPVKLTRHPGHYANPSWAPKGDRLAVLRGSGLEFRGKQPEEEDFFEIGVLDAAGGEIRYVGAVKLADAMKFHPQAFWNADGTRIFYRDPVEAKKPTDDPKNDLVSIRLDGTDKKRYLRFPAVDDLVPSPDEQWVVFTSRDNVYVTAFPGVLTKEPPEVGLKEGVRARLPPFGRRRRIRALGRRRQDDHLGPRATPSTACRSPRRSSSRAPSGARPRRRPKKEEAAKTTPDTEKEKADKEKEKVQEARVPKSETIEIALTAPRSAPARLVPSARRARHPDAGRPHPREHRHPRDRKPHRRGRALGIGGGAGRRPRLRGAGRRPSSRASSTRTPTCTTRGSSSSRKPSGSTSPTSPMA